ncbi:MAG: GAF domain-containing sensor histidine kinase [Deltaproteobacteria bacterium]|nr:GAF domain-containing sensor histidine kinase [Deltaproteobacteria bacterium]
MTNRANEHGADGLDAAIARGGGDLDDTMQHCADAVRELVGCEFAGVGLVDSDGAVVLRAVSSRTPVALKLGHRQAAGQGVTGEAIRRRAPVLVPDVRSHENYVPTGPDIVSEICCPLALGGAPFGFLDVAAADRALGAHELEQVSRLAQRLAAPLFVALSARDRESRRDELSAMMVHDLRNPVTLLSLTLEVLERARAGGGETAARALQEARASCEELLGLIDGILSVQKADSGRLELSLADLTARNVLPTVASRMHVLAAARRVELSCEVASDAPTARADVGLITRVLENLVSNALKFTPAGGRVVVSAELAPRWVLEARLPSASAGLLLSVLDTGPGVPAADRDRIFEKYAIVHGQRVGRFSTGLGLAFSKRAVVAHGGAVWVEPGSGGGSAFRVVLPVLA